MRFSVTFALLMALLIGLQFPCTGTAEEISIAFWNVENLLDQYDDPILPYDEKQSPSSVQERLGKDAEVIRSLDADIIGLAEVENLSVLKRMNNSFLNRSGYKYVALFDGEDPRGIDCALLSRRPFFAQSVDIPDFPRDLLVARFTTSSGPFYVVVVHWKSRRDGGGEDVRRVCSQATADCVNRVIVGYEGKVVPIVVMGDFNDTPQDQSLKLLGQQGLTNTMLSIDQDVRWTIGSYDRDQSKMNLDCFDQILINSAAQKGGSIIWRSTKVHRPRFMINDRRSFNGVRIPLPIDDYKDRIGYSDHFPVISRFTISGS